MTRALVILLLLAGTASADGPRTTPIGFDHMVHDRNLIVGGKEALACARCHVEQQGKVVGKPGHAACFGACHGAPPVAPKRGAKLVVGDRQKICTACHAESALVTPYAGKLAVSYPPYAVDIDFNITFGHKQHAPVACTQCHEMRAGKPKVGPRSPAFAGSLHLVPHERCASCHDGTKTAGHGPAMAKCSGCHPQAVGKPEPPELAAVNNTVTSTFSHPKHGARGAAGKDCTACHAGILTTDDTQLPRPRMTDCASSGCHDGKAAFATTAACTKCHDKAPSEFAVWREPTQFIHGGLHADAIKNRTCSACHPLGARGEVIVAGHTACADCHAADFGERKPRICGACHNATEPWRKLVADRAPAPRTEFGATLDHDKHPAACTTCHQLRTASSQLRPPRGHAACSGDGCHAVKSGPVPRFETCDGCHRLGLAATRETARVTAAWSVRRAFDHSTHRKTPDGELACRACHVDLKGANVVDLATPAKAACKACHDEGKPAFKLTGTNCTRCHAGAK